MFFLCIIDKKLDKMGMLDRTGQWYETENLLRISSVASEFRSKHVVLRRRIRKSIGLGMKKLRLQDWTEHYLL